VQPGCPVEQTPPGGAATDVGVASPSTNGGHLRALRDEREGPPGRAAVALDATTVAGRATDAVQRGDVKPCLGGKQNPYAVLLTLTTMHRPATDLGLPAAELDGVRADHAA